MEAERSKLLLLFSKPYFVSSLKTGIQYRHRILVPINKGRINAKYANTSGYAYFYTLQIE